MEGEGGVKVSEKPQARATYCTIAQRVYMSNTHLSRDFPPKI